MRHYLSLIAIYAVTLVYSETIETGNVETVLQCDLCVDRFNWTHCDEAARSRECSVKLVDETHNFLAQYSPELNSTRSGSRQFRCFLLELEIDVSSVNVFIRGCTYDDTKFCDGWSANGAKATNCAVCSTGLCERNATWDAGIPDTTTTTAVSTSTTTVSSTGQSSPITTTTELMTEAPSVLNWTATATSTVKTTPEKMVSTSSSVSPTSTRTIETTSTTTLSVVTQTTSEATTSSDPQSGVTGVSPANTFKCTKCISSDSWEDCRNNSQVTQCTAAYVNQLHGQLWQFNPNLPVGSYSEFKCFTMQANFSDAEGSAVAYIMGCTFASARFCTRSEWHNFTITECSGANLMNAGNVMCLTIVATLMMFVCQLMVKW